MAPTYPLKIVMGAAGIGQGKALGTQEVLGEVLNTLDEYGIDTIDTAHLYTDSQDFLGQAGAGKRFTIDSKAYGGFKEGTLSNTSFVADAKSALEKTGAKQMDIFYIHAPDYTKKLDDYLPGVNEAYKKGYFKRFGLSNFRASDVEAIHAYCKEHDYILPSVYQGNYSPVARRQETELFPTLRKLGMVFYAYSPIAGGFLTKTRQDIIDGKTRWAKGSLYEGLYSTPAYLEALDGWDAIAKDAGLHKGELAYRWAAGNSVLDGSRGDALIVGAGSVKQLKETLGWLQKGKLEEGIARKIDLLWKTIEHEAPLDNFHKRD